jgi:hypothetical protein
MRNVGELLNVRCEGERCSNVAGSVKLAVLAAPKWTGGLALH